MLEVKIFQLINALESLKEMATQKIAAKAAFCIAKTLKVIGEEMDLYEKARIDLVKKYALRNEDGELKLNEKNDAEFDNDGMISFNKEFQDLLNTKLELPLQTISIKLLKDAQIEPKTLAILDWLFVE